MTEAQVVTVTAAAETGFTYYGKPLTDILKDIGRGELIDPAGGVWSSRNPEAVPTGEPGDPYNVPLKTSEGSREVHSHILAVMILGGATAGDLLKRFMAEGMTRGAAFGKIGREFPEAHGDFLHTEARRQAKEREARR